MLEEVHEISATATPKRSEAEQISLDKLLGLAVFGEKVAAVNYAYMAELRPEHETRLHEFSRMEAAHGAWFAEGSRQNGITPDRAFADAELGYLKDQIAEHYAAKDFDAIAVVQGFIVESLAIAAYEPIARVADKYPGMRKLFEQAAAEERYHVEWITRYFRLRFYEANDEFLGLTRRVNVQGIDCVGGTMMNIVDCLDEIGVSGADCAGGMMDLYTQLLENVGIRKQDAIKNVVTLFTPAIRKYRRGEKAK